MSGKQKIYLVQPQKALFTTAFWEGKKKKKKKTTTKLRERAEEAVPVNNNYPIKGWFLDCYLAHQIVYTGGHSARKTLPSEF